MKDSKFDKKLKQKIKSEIEIPNNIDSIVMDGLNIKEKPILKLKFTKAIQTIIAVLSLLAISGGVYAGITGNSILSFLGFGKASENFENSAIDINKTIDYNYAKITIERLACDGCLLIVEYDVRLKDQLFEDTNSSIIEEFGFCDYFNTRINNKEYNAYKAYTEKISNNEFLYYEIFDVSGEESNNYKLVKYVCDFYIKSDSGTHEIDALIDYHYNSSEESGEMQEGIIEYDFARSFLVDFSTKGKNPKNIEEQIINFDKNSTLTIKNVNNTEFGVFILADAQINNLVNGDVHLTDLTFKSNSGETVNTVLLKDQIITENDEVIDILDYYEGENEVYRNGINQTNTQYHYEVDTFDIEDLLRDNPELAEDTEFMKSLSTEDYETVDENFEKNDYYIDDQIEYSNGTAYIRFLIILPNKIESSNISLRMNRYEEVLLDEILIDIGNTENSKTVINEIGTDKDENIDIEIFTAPNKTKKVKNQYYNANAKKINIADINFNGIKPGMTLDESLELLKKVYDKNGIEINIQDNIFELDDVENNIYECEYYDDNICFRAFKDNNDTKIVYEIYFQNAELWNKENIREKDIISKYFSNEYMEERYNMGHKEKILYSDGFDENGELLGDYAVIYSGDDIDTVVKYYDSSSKMMISFDLEPSTKIITQFTMTWYTDEV